MKTRYSVIASALALVVLVIIQYYNISVTFQTKKEQFDSRYKSLVKQALYDYESPDNQFPSDSVFHAFDELAVGLVFQGLMPCNMPDGDSLGIRILNSFSRILANHRKPDNFLAGFLEEAGADPDFRSGYQIRELYLIDIGDCPVFTDTTEILPAGLEDALSGFSYTMEGNYYRISFDYLVDFTHKTRIIYRDMVITMVLALVTILIVLVIFTLTLRNMLIQQRLSEMKTDFINNMTHELKTPLSTIAVASSSLGDETLLQDRKKVIQISDMIKKQNRHLTQLIDRILDISIWEKDQVRLERKSVHIYEFIEEKIKDFRIEMQDRHIDIVTEYRLDKDYIMLDEVHMTTVFNNLLSNAVKYCEQNPVIRISVTVNHRLAIRIRDNGIGISRESQKHIFDKFYRVRKGDFRTVKGLGLGLYYVNQIITAHGGEIELQSNPGKGSTFTIYIPTDDEYPAG